MLKIKNIIRSICRIWIVAILIYNAAPYLPSWTHPFKGVKSYNPFGWNYYESRMLYIRTVWYLHCFLPSSACVMLSNFHVASRQTDKCKRVFMREPRIVRERERERERDRETDSESQSTSKILNCSLIFFKSQNMTSINTKLVTNVFKLQNGLIFNRNQAKLLIWIAIITQ